MSKFEQPTHEHLRGWLLVYVLVVAVPGTVWNGVYFWALVMSGIYGPDTMVRFLAFAVFAIGLCLIIWVRNRITREYIIWLNLTLACIYFVLGFLRPYPRASFEEFAIAIAGVWFFFWLAYWMRSERVKKTYCQKAPWIP